MWSRYGYVRLRSSHFSIRVMIDGPPFVHVREDPSNVAAPTHSLCGDKVGQLNDIADPSQQVVCSTIDRQNKTFRSVANRHGDLAKRLHS